MICIYKIESQIKPNQFYIGSSINAKKRWAYHISCLKRNLHPNTILQNHFNKYGIDDLKFSICVQCDKEQLVQFEQYYLDFYQPYFNIRPKAESNLGIKYSSERVEKMRELSIRLGLKPPSQLGIKQSIETKNKRSRSMLGKNKYLRTAEHRQKLSDAKKNKPGNARGSKMSEESKQKLSNSLKEYHQNKKVRI